LSWGWGGTVDWSWLGLVLHFGGNGDRNTLVKLCDFFFQLYGINFTRRIYGVVNGTGVAILGVLSGADVASR